MANNPQILVVEDEGIVAKGIEAMLKKLGYDVPAVVSSGTEAIKKAVETHPDLVLMDIVLEGDIDGIEAAAQINSRFDIPVVFLTAHADELTIKKAKMAEPFGYVVKPFNERELHATIEMAIHTHAMRRTVTTTGRTIKLNRVLGELADTKGVNAVAVVSTEGVVVGLSAPLTHNEISPFSSLVAMAIRTMEKCALMLKQGALEEIVTKTENGELAIIKCGKFLVLVAGDRGFDFESIKAKREHALAIVRDMA